MTNDELLTKNMELAGVIRAIRANAREDAKRIEELERERDEAREAYDSNRITLHEVIAKGVRVERERDEARAFIEELVDLVAYGLGQNASIWSQAAMRKAREVISKAKTLEGKK